MFSLVIAQNKSNSYLLCSPNISQYSVSFPLSQVSLFPSFPKFSFDKIFLHRLTIYRKLFPSFCPKTCIPKDYFSRRLSDFRRQFQLIFFTQAISRGQEVESVFSLITHVASRPLFFPIVVIPAQINICHLAIPLLLFFISANFDLQSLHHILKSLSTWLKFFLNTPSITIICPFCVTLCE